MSQSAPPRGVPDITFEATTEKLRGEEVVTSELGGNMTPGFTEARFYCDPGSQRRFQEEKDAKEFCAEDHNVDILPFVRLLQHNPGCWSDRIQSDPPSKDEL